MITRPHPVKRANSVGVDTVTLLLTNILSTNSRKFSKNFVSRFVIELPSLSAFAYNDFSLSRQIATIWWSKKVKQRNSLFRWPLTRISFPVKMQFLFSTREDMQVVLTQPIGNYHNMTGCELLRLVEPS